MADQLKKRMGELTVDTVALPEKRAPGTLGAATEFVTNLTSLKLKPNVPFFKYDIRMYIVYKSSDGKEHLKELTKQTKDDFPEQERKTGTVLVYKHLLKTNPSVFPQDGALLYDRAAVLFSAQKQIKLDGEEKVFMLPASLVPSAGEDATGVRVVVKKVTEGFQVTSNDLAKAVNVRDFEKDKGILEVLNLAVSQKGYMETSQFVTYGSGVHYLFDHRALGFRDHEVPELMDGKYMGIGLSKSVKVLEGEGQSCNAYVVTDVTKGAFHIDDQNLLEKISQMSMFIDPRSGQSHFNIQAAMQPINQKNILQLIKGLYVRTTYGKKRTFPIGNIAQAANQLKFQTVEGTQCTVEQYFKKHYNIVLKHPGMFTVSERHSPHTYYPVELLRVAPSQRVTLQQQTPDQVATMIKACATLPQNRLHQTKLLKDALDIKPGNSRLAVAGISVENGFTTVPGRVLPPPSIIYGGNQLVKPIDNCKWNGDRSRFLEPARLYNWAVCATLTPNDSRRLHIKEYIARVEGRCRQRGMDVEPCSEIFNLQRQNFESLKEWYASQKEKDRRYLMFITSDHIKQHDLIKLLEIEYQIVSQEIKGSKVDAVLTRNQNQTLDNVIAKINEKLGGVNYNIMLGSSPSDKANKWLSEKDRMFVGFEISNPPALSKAEIERGAAYKESGSTATTMADQLKKRMGELTVDTVALPEKRAPGTLGAATEFVTNLTSLKLKPNVPFFKYDIRMYIVYKSSDGKEHLKELTKQTKDDFPEQERKTGTVLVYKHLLKTNPSVFPQDGALLYDRAAVLFSAQKQIKLDGEEKVFMLPASLVPSAGEDATGVRVVVKKVTEGFQVTSNDLAKAVNVRDFEKDKGILEVLNLAVSQKGYMETSQFVTYGSGVHYLFDHRALGFRDHEVPELMDGKYMGIGLSKSVKVLEGEGESCTAYVVTDVTKGAFHIDDQNLLEKISQMSMFIDPRSGQSHFNIQAAMQPINQKNILQLIKGLYVRTTYGKKRTFPIGNIAQAANQLKFQTVEGTQCTVEQYFKKHYNIVLKHPGMFTVSERHSPHTYYPVELLRVAPSQRVTLQQQTPDQVATMIKACATLPQNRLHQTKLLKDALDIKPGNSRLAVAGISVENGFTTVPGRVLPPPSIIYGGNQLVKPIDNCKWNGDRSRFLEPARLYNWAVCATLTPNDSRRLHIKEYIARVEGRCRQRGMDVEPCSEIFNLQRQNFESLKEWYASQKEKDRRYLMFITSDHIKQHDLIKLLEIEYQIVSQEIKGSKVDAVLTRNQNQTLDNVIAKINEKLGGVNYNIMLGSSPSDKANKWLSEKDRMFVGFEISNPPALSKAEIERGAAYKMPSVLGWGANCAKNPQQYLGDYVYIEPRQTDMMGAKLSEIIVHILKRFRAATDVAPRHIVLYFSGISEGQWSLVADTYMRAIQTGIKSLSATYGPSLTALTVSKDHIERIYKSNITGNRATEQNIPPGTVVDTKIVSPVINEFYLNAHSAFQGTTKTPKYALVYDDSNIPINAVEGMTHGLCYLHEIITATVSMPVPLIVADRCAKRGHNVYIANSSQRNAVSCIKEANEKLVNQGALQKVRYNA
ncbi:hypothetical protein RB195_004586 [Necator americanus]|uniref:Piwi domain protein n=1 Tax=Necator americanus TaxID=51031 RepID=A0ABR1BMD2_NECAM